MAEHTSLSPLHFEILGMQSSMVQVERSRVTIQSMSAFHATKKLIWRAPRNLEILQSCCDNVKISKKIIGKIHNWPSTMYALTQSVIFSHAISIQNLLSINRRQNQTYVEQTRQPHKQHHMILVQYTETETQTMPNLTIVCTAEVGCV